MIPAQTIGRNSHKSGRWGFNAEAAMPAELAEDATVRDRERGLTLCVLGGWIKTSNLGVSALGTSAVMGLRLAFPQATLIVQGWGREKTLAVPHPDGDVQVESLLFHPSQSLRASAGTKRLRAIRRLARLMPGSIARVLERSNRTLDQLLRSDVVLDVCGGDSFADIYGPWGFEFQAALKLFVKELGKPLVLLPQTYGPFKDERSIALTREIVEYSSLVASRDVGGIEELRRVVGGPSHDRVASCPDMAFLLDPLPVEPEREPFLNRVGQRPVIGLNVSGLLYLTKFDFGSRESYADLINGIADWAVNECGAQLVLVPHVLSENPPSDDVTGAGFMNEISDSVACHVLMKRLADRYGERVVCLGWPYGAGETKYLVGKCDFFLGARMHACIGAISQAVPTVTFAYSKKALGVLSHAGMQEAVLDLRELSNAECMARVRLLYDRRRDLRAMLQERIPQVKRAARQFFVHDLPEAIGIPAAVGVGETAS